MPENYDDLFAEVEQDRAPAEPQGGQLSKEEFAAKMKAERDGLSELASQTGMLLAADDGTFRQYLDTLARFDRYSAQNTLLIFAQRPDATKLGDYDHWKEAGTPVRRNETGFSIFEPGKEYRREDGSTGVSMNIKRMFDISQTEARDKPQPEPAHDIRTLLKALMSNTPAPIKLVDSLPDGIGAHYNEQRGVIEVVRGLDGDSLFRCLAQEIAYAELSRHDAAPCRDKSFTAYAASYALCAKHGVDTKGYYFGKVTEHFAECDGREIRGEIKAIRDTVNDVSTRMARVLNPPERKAPAQEARS
ncbi:MAG: hypothetical protein FWC62_04100 [Firmicutes bacterium]|nr:hypothetical protein [Bacillota bacterium]